jgi:hypothetical protein
VSHWRRADFWSDRRRDAGRRAPQGDSPAQGNKNAQCLGAGRSRGLKTYLKYDPSIRLHHSKHQVVANGIGEGIRKE